MPGHRDVPGRHTGGDHRAHLARNQPRIVADLDLAAGLTDNGEALGGQFTQDGIIFVDVIGTALFDVSSVHVEHVPGRRVRGGWRLLQHLAGGGRACKNN
jgi:hypothetical protein